jgi:hypothetical protein
VVGKKRHRRKEDSGDTATAGAGGRAERSVPMAGT